MTEGSADHSTVSAGTTYYPWECLATAVRFLTRVPVSDGLNRSPAQHAELLRRSLVYFPFVGGLVGLFTAAVMLTSISLGTSPILGAFIALGLEAVLTGALHEDAFADTCDALGGGWTRERVLEIMKCSQLGTFGVVALVVGLGARAAAMVAISEHGRLWAIASIVAAASVGRLAMLCMMVTTQPIPDGSSLTKSIAGNQNVGSVLVALCISSPFWAGWLVLESTAVCASLAAAVAALYWFRRKIFKVLNGTTGDVLGCSAFLTQLVLLIGASLK